MNLTRSCVKKIVTLQCYSIVLGPVPSRADSDQDVKLKAREVTVDKDDPQYPHQALHVYSTNMAARKKNDEMLAHLDGQLYINVATDSVTDKKANIAKIIVPDDPQKTGRLMHTLQLKVGARGYAYK